MKKFDQVQQGDIVFCLVNGEGKVTELQVDTKGELFQFMVLFTGISSSFVVKYDLDGKSTHYSAPTLFWKQPNMHYITDNAPRRRYTKTYYAAMNNDDVIAMFSSEYGRKNYLDRNSNCVAIIQPITVEYIK